MQCCKKTSKTSANWKLPALVLLLSFGAIVAIAAIRGGGRSTGGSSAAAPSGGRIIIDPLSQEIGTVRMRDGVRTLTYAVKNDGKETLTLTGMETSCMCTTAYLEAGGRASPTFGMQMHGGNPRGWSEALRPGESATLVVKFDPNAHGPSGVGPFMRVVTVRSSDPVSPEAEVRFNGVVAP